MGGERTKFFFNVRELLMYFSYNHEAKARTRVLPDQDKRKVLKIGIKPKTTSPRPFLGKSFKLGMTRGTYDTGRGLLMCVTAAFSADIPCVDARPYHLVIKRSFDSGKDLF